MGQRSQIYVRINDEENQKAIEPRYYQWNYGTRMISRTRGILEWLRVNMLHPSLLFEDEGREKLRRVMDINWDYHDVVLGEDMTAEYIEYNNGYGYNETIFNYDNNDGKLLIDVVVDYSRKNKNGRNPVKYKYAFLDCNNNGPMDAEAYLNWDLYGDGCWTDCDFIKDEVAYTKRNINWIKKNAVLMTAEEIEEYLNYDYSADREAA